MSKEQNEKQIPVLTKKVSPKMITVAEMWERYNNQFADQFSEAEIANSKNDFYSGFASFVFPLCDLLSTHEVSDVLELLKNLATEIEFFASEQDHKITHGTQLRVQ